MTTDPRTELRDKIAGCFAEFLREEACDCDACLSSSAADVLAALATEPDLWQYGMPDPDEGPDAVMSFEGRPRIITPRMLRRPMRAVGPWRPAPTTEETT